MEGEWFLEEGCARREAGVVTGEAADEEDGKAGAATGDLGGEAYSIRSGEVDVGEEEGDGGVGLEEGEGGGAGVGFDDGVAEFPEGFDGVASHVGVVLDGEDGHGGAGGMAAGSSEGWVWPSPGVRAWWRGR